MRVVKQPHFIFHMFAEALNATINGFNEATTARSWNFGCGQKLRARPPKLQ